MSTHLRLLPDPPRPTSRIVLRRVDDQPIALGRPRQLLLARLVSSIVGHRLHAWRSAGRRLVVLVTEPPGPAAELARRLSIGARQRLGAPFLPARVTLLEDPAAVQACVRRLFADVRQPFVPASSLPDAEGLRALAPSTTRTAGLIPLTQPAGAVLSWPLRELPVWDGLQRETAAAFGYEDLSRRFPWRTRALSAAASLAFPELGPQFLARQLGVSRSTVHRALARPADRRLRRMIERRLRWGLALSGTEPRQWIRSASPSR